MLLTVMRLSNLPLPARPTRDAESNPGRRAVSQTADMPANHLDNKDKAVTPKTTYNRVSC